MTKKQFNELISLVRSEVYSSQYNKDQYDEDDN